MTTLIRTLASKPWLSGQDEVGAPAKVEMFDLPREKVGLRVFFAVAASLFMLFIVGYRLRMVYGDWVPLHEPLTLWINSAFLLLASVAFQIAKRAAATGKEQTVRRAFYVGGALSILFVTGQLAVWQQLSQAGHFVASNPASSFFYLLTGVHGAHIVGGLVAWGRTLPKLQPGSDAAAARMSVDLCTVYWHFLLLVWVVLFYLLLST
jgi:cytochrome c oxidase subunit 3